nr:hypothetical protein [Subtercola lobariae]
MNELVKDLAESRASRLVIERDDSLVSADRRMIRTALETHNYVEHLSYAHVSPSDEPLLWVSDAVAWCFQAGGDWVRRASPLVRGHTKLGRA